MIGIPIAMLYANASEWFIHKNVLHGIGKRKSSFWSFHFHDHHKACRRQEGRDDGYRESILGWHAQGKEALALAALGVAHAPLLPIAPFFTLTVWASILRYHRVHRRSHLDAEWARQNLTWHYDHHMGPDQDANWCVTHPFFDHLMGTRKRYAFTREEETRRVQEAEKRERRAQGASPLRPVHAA